jgi:prepilin-type N-terminal cleavage/methylation domain-containing protein
MQKQVTKSQRGFTLIELLVSACIGLILMVAVTRAFNEAQKLMFVITQRADMQQNMRAGIELMTKDISMAGAGLPSGGLQMANGGGQTKVACNQTNTCYVPNDFYPLSPTGVENFMYGILPGFSNGVQGNAVITATPGVVNDSITSIYCDYNFSLSNFTFTFANVQGTQVNVAVNNAGVTPNNILAPGGLNVGDLMLFIVSTPGPGNGNQGNALAQTAAAVGEITGIPNNTEIQFVAGDELNVNQVGDPNSLASVAAAAVVAGTEMTVCRLYAVTYFLQVPPVGGTVQTPRLMRQVNGLTAIPVADNIINLQFSYDVINSTNNTISANVANPIAAGLSPGLIQKVNIWIMAQGVVSSGNRSQSMYLASSVSARNMSFCNSFSSNLTCSQ